MADVQTIKSKKAPSGGDPNSLFYTGADAISTLLLELGQARAIVDLLFMVASGKAVDSVDGMRDGTLESSLHIVLQRLEAVEEAATAILDQGAREVAHG